MKSLVTGSSGFLGSNLIEKLTGEIVRYDINNNPQESLENTKLLREKLAGVSVVYHLAGISDPQSSALYEVNVMGTQKLINTISEFEQVIKVVFASTFGVYKIPLKGDVINENYPTIPRNNYGKSKLTAERIVLKNDNNIVLRFSNVYGPGMPSGKHSVVSNFIDAILNNKKIIINNKDTSRDFIYIDDLVSALINAGRSNKTGIFNICSGEETGIIDLLKLIEQKTKRKTEINVINSFTNDGFWKGNFSKAKKNLDWMPTVNIDEGLSLTIDKLK